MGGLKLALYGLHRDADPKTLTRRARLAEEAGFESFWIGDHPILPADDDQPRLEVITALTYLAAVTRSARLAAGVIVLPQRQPVLLAKQLSSLDVLSQGRLIVGIGVGYIESELRALGASLADRGARTGEYLAAMRALWAEQAAPFDGRYVSFTGVQRPRPQQRPHPPVVVGGHSPAAYRRAIRHGNGWYGWDLTLDQAASALAELRETAARIERPAALGDLEITITPNGAVDVDLARRFASLGVHRLVLQAHPALGATIDELIGTAADSLMGRV